MAESIKKSSSNSSVHKKVAQGMAWMTFVYLILCGFVCLLLWGILSLAIHIK